MYFIALVVTLKGLAIEGEYMLVVESPEEISFK